MSIYALEPRQASAGPLERFRSQVRAAVTPSPTNPSITPAQALLAAADILAERADGSAILTDLADRVSDVIASWAMDWGLGKDVASDDITDWIGNEPAISTTVIIIN